jgi:hypothetical protein
MKIKFITSYLNEDLERDINAFIKDKDVINIKVMNSPNRVMIMYKEDK